MAISKDMAAGTAVLAGCSTLAEDLTLHPVLTTINTFEIVPVVMVPACAGSKGGCSKGGRGK